ncbi:MAG: amino acid ABC transporter permease, partial [Bacteroidia bacterium]|nr:amino acid ABC transporter permease [Bacteroidia bacterium]
MTLDWNIVWQHRWDLAHGAGLTVLLTVLTMLAAVPAGIVLALMRLSRSRILSTASLWFVEFFRNLPLILVVYWAFYVMPVFLHIEFSAFTTGLIALCLNVSAYNAETFRAGINSIRKGQMEAAIAVGMSRWQAMKQIIIPQAWRRVLPVL